MVASSIGTPALVADKRPKTLKCSHFEGQRDSRNFTKSSLANDDRRRGQDLRKPK
jgi:hypothetical protein